MSNTQLDVNQVTEENVLEIKKIFNSIKEQLSLKSEDEQAKILEFLNNETEAFLDYIKTNVKK